MGVRFRKTGIRPWHLALILLGAGWWLALPDPLFDLPHSVVVEDRQGELLSARIAADGQWRFPAPDSVPYRFATALIAFEDKRFWYHPGIDPLALLRACYQNARAGRIVSGGSTLSMQVLRLSAGGGPRTLRRKLWEMLMALRLELGATKEEILLLYAAHAPFGGNVVGVEAAAWRYFGKRPDRLSWAEAATLAVLPNAPALIHPARQRHLLRRKRDRLLRRLWQQGILDSTSYQLALAEPLPGPPQPLPDLAPHLAEHLRRRYPEGGRFRTTLDRQIQLHATERVATHARSWAGKGVHNAAALILDTRSGAVRAWVGNARACGAQHNEWVDMVTAARSPGSTLKPLLYAFLLDRGQLLPRQLLFDLPTWYGGYHPRNYHMDYDGLVPADLALARSLNVPAVGMLQMAGVPVFLNRLRRWGFRHLDKPAAHYGLSLILGSGEVTLWELCGVYAAMGRTLLHFDSLPGPARYVSTDLHPPFVLAQNTSRSAGATTLRPPFLRASAIWFAFEAMKQVARPDAFNNWQIFQSSRPLAWKTGTSVGFRDAWAIGVDPAWTVGVWVGNADGEGRAGLVGVHAAAPLMFSLLELRPPPPHWFPPPYDDMEYVALCAQSGMLAAPWCPADTALVPLSGLEGPVCTFHRVCWFDPSRKWQVHRGCAPEAVADTVFVVPAVATPWYARHHPEYAPPPPYRPDCAANAHLRTSVSIIYPPRGLRIHLPIDLDGTPQAMVCRAATARPRDVLYWMLDDRFVGTTSERHELALRPEVGPHTLTVIDAAGTSASVAFTVE